MRKISFNGLYVSEDPEWNNWVSIHDRLFRFQSWRRLSGGGLRIKISDTESINFYADGRIHYRLEAATPQSTMRFDERLQIYETDKGRWRLRSTPETTRKKTEKGWELIQDIRHRRSPDGKAQRTVVVRVAPDGSRFTYVKKLRSDGTSNNRLWIQTGQERSFYRLRGDAPIDGTSWTGNPGHIPMKREIRVIKVIKFKVRSWDRKLNLVVTVDQDGIHVSKEWVRYRFLDLVPFSSRNAAPTVTEK